MYISSADP